MDSGLENPPFSTIAEPEPFEFDKLYLQRQAVLETLTLYGENMKKKITLKILFYVTMFSVFVLFLTLNNAQIPFTGIKDIIIILVAAGILRSNFENKMLLKNTEQEKIIETHNEAFAATLTHDLKTPVIAQIRSLELLLGGAFGELNKEQKEMLSGTLESCKYMHTMISDILSAYKYENGDVRLINMDFDFYALVKECCVELTSAAQSKGQTITLKSSSRAPFIYGDRAQLKRAVMNLISNSISHGYENSEITAVIEETKEGTAFVSINECPDIPGEILDKVFEKYATGAAKFNKVGTGPGLYLSQRIISAHLGSMTAKSENNHTTFGFIVPHKKRTDVFSHV